MAIHPDVHWSTGFNMVARDAVNPDWDTADTVTSTIVPAAEFRFDRTTTVGTVSNDWGNTIDSSALQKQVLGGGNCGQGFPS